MTREQKIELLAQMVNYTNEEGTGILEIYLDIAGDKILNRMYPFLTDYENVSVPDRYARIQLNVAAYMYNKIGAEGQVQHIENGIHRNYGSADVPEEMLRDIHPMAVALR